MNILKIYWRQHINLNAKEMVSSTFKPWNVKYKKMEKFYHSILQAAHGVPVRLWRLPPGRLHQPVWLLYEVKCPPPLSLSLFLTLSLSFSPSLSLPLSFLLSLYLSLSTSLSLPLSLTLSLSLPLSFSPSLFLTLSLSLSLSLPLSFLLSLCLSLSLRRQSWPFGVCGSSL